MSAVVSIKKRTWTRRGHGGLSEETDYNVLLHGPGKPCHLRMFSTSGNMSEGYWGSAARSSAIRYAQLVAAVLGQDRVVIWKEKEKVL